MANYQEIITIDPQDAVPRIRHLKISVQQILDLISKGITEQQILELHRALTLEDINACRVYAAVNPKRENSLDKIIGDLENTSKRLNWGGYILFTISIILGIVLYLDVRFNTISHIDNYLTFKDGTTIENIYPRLIYLIVRSSALGVISTTVVVFCVKTAIACFDQSARFLKRRNGALFLKHLFDSFSNDKLEEKVKLEEIRKFFESWNQTVESAFSTVKADKKAAGSVEVNLTKDGAMFKTDDREK
jgi:uncharacterized protein (DUF433 family)